MCTYMCVCISISVICSKLEHQSLQSEAKKKKLSKRKKEAYCMFIGKSQGQDMIGKAMSLSQSTIVVFLVLQKEH